MLEENKEQIGSITENTNVKEFSLTTLMKITIILNRTDLGKSKMTFTKRKGKKTDGVD